MAACLAFDLRTNPWSPTSGIFSAGSTDHLPSNDKINKLSTVLLQPLEDGYSFDIQDIGNSLSI